MYIATARQTPSEKKADRGRVAGNVLALGLVSLVTDVSSEMVTAVLPLYFVVALGLSPFQFGLLDGLYSGVTAVVRLLGGHAADRWQRRKAVALAGYGMSAVAKLGFLAAGSSVGALGGVLAVDRTGKGLRTAPRDALISLSSAPDALGRAFGVHRAMDTVGAFLGPLVAIFVLWASLGSYDAVFVTSFCFAVLGVLLLAMLVRDKRSPLPARPRLKALWRGEFRRVVGWASLLGLVTVGDAFLYLLLQQELRLDAVHFPLLALGTAAVYLLLAVPLGRLADRVGRWPVFLAGHVALALAFGLLLTPFVNAFVVLALHGAFYAATDGVLMAAAGPLLPAELRTSGMAVLQTGQALAKLVSSVLFGAMWTFWGVPTALLVSLAALVVVLGGAAVLRPLSS
ncbi:MFS transporter [Saccharothrix australiensis]|uniref:MFS transporter n=1 Tax=Saccharothrix australiensis TaxID=2072 RepID=A0A495W7G5_9PSEU|nr:MFS transporter [Saccharothrix australiensis]RKT57214.1 MFS transporter [Saccharothrix australiensis]